MKFYRDVFVMLAMAFVFTVALVSIFGTSQIAQAAPLVKSSYYAATEGNEIGLLVPYKNMTLFNSDMFNTASLGIFVMTGDTFNANGYSGLVKMTGSCHQTRPDYYIEIYTKTDAGLFLVAGGMSKFYDFEFVTSSPWIQIGAAQYVVQNYDLLKCALLFEAVK